MKNILEKFDNKVIDPIITLKFIEETLELTIKKDIDSKLVTFLAMISAYTKESSYNVTFLAPSSTGKSYIPMQISTLFPKEDVLKYAYSSPTAFFHQAGVVDRLKKITTIDLSNKIIIFQDLPHTQLFERLRPMLSHDEKILKVQITDKNQSGGNSTKTIELIGYPAVVFCSANTHINEQESTRFILLSPELNQEKIKQGIEMKITREADPDKFSFDLNHDTKRIELVKRIKQIKNACVNEIRIKSEDAKYIDAEYTNMRHELKPRHQRDIARLLSIIKSIALINYMHRERVDNDIFANRDDIDNAISLWNEIAMSQELNLPPFIYDIYWDVIVPCYLEKNAITSNKVGISRSDITKSHYKFKKTTLDSLSLRQQILPVLRDTGLILEEVDEKDARIKLITPTMLNKDEIYSHNDAEKEVVNGSDSTKNILVESGANEKYVETLFGVE